MPWCTATHLRVVVAIHEVSVGRRGRECHCACVVRVLSLAWLGYLACIANEMSVAMSKFCLAGFGRGIRRASSVHHISPQVCLGTHMQPFATERCVTARCNTPFERSLRTPVGGARSPGAIAVPKSEPLFPHQIGYTVTRPSTTAFSFGTGFGRPVGMLNVTSSIDNFNTSTSSFGSTTSHGSMSSPMGSATARPTFSNFANPVGRSMWTTTPGNRSFYPLPLGRHTFGVVKR